MNFDTYTERAQSVLQAAQTAALANSNQVFTPEHILKAMLEDRDQLTTDVLVKYLWNPWKALYVGYTSNRRDFEEFDEDSMTLMELRDEGHQVFVKFSYLFQL